AVHYRTGRALPRGRVSARTSDGRTELVIFGPIGSFEGEVSARAVRDHLRATRGDVLLRINSPGGDVFEAVAIHSLLREHGRVTARVDGLAASAASVIAMAGKRIEMAQGALMMVHHAHGLGLGNADDFRKLAATLDKVDEQLIGIYASRTGL